MQSKTKLVRVECDPMCGFIIQSHDKSEVKKYTVEHVKNSHNKEMSDKDVEKAMKVM